MIISWLLLFFASLCFISFVNMRSHDKGNLLIDSILLSLSLWFVFAGMAGFIGG